MDHMLFVAAKEGDVSRLRLLVAADSNIINSVTPQENTALHIAVRFGHEEFVKEICALRPMLLGKANSRGETPLHCAAIGGHHSIVSFFIKCVQRSPGDLQHLLRMTNRNGDTALHESVRNGHVSVLTELVISDEQLLTLVNNKGESALYLAAQRGQLQLVQVFLQFPLSSHWGMNGQTDLHAAVLMGCKAIARALLEARPGLTKEVDVTGSTPLHYAAQLGNLELVRLLLGYDASIAYAVDGNSDSPIHVSARMGNVYAMSMLIQHSSDSLDVVDKKGRTALHIAVEVRYAFMVRCILKMDGIEGIINQQDDDGNTPFHLAAINCDPWVIDALLEDERLEKNVVNNKGQTTLDAFYADVDMTATLKWLRVLLMLADAFAKNNPVIWHSADRRLKANYVEFVKLVARRYVKNGSIVATLMATVTFAAAFTVPGGFQSDQGLNPGQGVLTKKPAFKAFLISDTIAMCSSLATVILSIYVSDDVAYLMHYMKLAQVLIWLAFGGMIVAFTTGVYAVVASDCLWLVIVIFVLCFSVVFFTSVLALWPIAKLLFRYRSTFLWEVLWPIGALTSISVKAIKRGFQKRV